MQNEEYVDLFDDDFLPDMARRYGVSAQALVNRLKNLGYIPDSAEFQNYACVVRMQLTMVALR